MSSKKPKKAPTGDYAVGYARPEGDPIPARPVWQPCWPPTGPAIPRRAAAGGGGAHRQAPGRRQGPAHGPRPRVDAQAVRYGPPGQGAGDPLGPGAPGASADRPQRQGRAAGDRQGSRSWLCDCDPALGKVERAIAQTPKIERKRPSARRGSRPSRRRSRASRCPNTSIRSIRWFSFSTCSTIAITGRSIYRTSRAAVLSVAPLPAPCGRSQTRRRHRSSPTTIANGRRPGTSVVTPCAGLIEARRGVVTPASGSRSGRWRSLGGPIQADGMDQLVAGRQTSSAQYSDDEVSD
jgi:hypothetical protein